MSFIPYVTDIKPTTGTYGMCGTSYIYRIDAIGTLGEIGMLWCMINKRKVRTVPTIAEKTK
jgi:hypothetical protein